jgi:ApbE superfamily uncharacterized protein (UPF0280 family)
MMVIESNVSNLLVRENACEQEVGMRAEMNTSRTVQATFARIGDDFLTSDCVSHSKETNGYSGRADANTVHSLLVSSADALAICKCMRQPAFLAFHAMQAKKGGKLIPEK